MKLEHKYSDNIFNKKIVIIGIEPPPLGGIAVHIERVIAKFLNQQNSVILIDVIKQSRARSRVGYFLYLIKTICKAKPDIIYYHTLSLRKLPIELGCLIFLKTLLNGQLILIDHTPRFFYGKSRFYRKTLRLLLYFIDKHILIGDATYKAYLENRIFLPPLHTLGKNGVSIESPYLPPDFTKMDEIYSKYPENLKNFMARCSPIVLINGSAMRLLNGVDLYGFDMALELLSPDTSNELLEMPRNTGLIIVLAEIGDQDYFNKINSKIKYPAVAEGYGGHRKNIYLLLGCSQEIWPLFKKIDLFIRPTCSDAYGISIQEALDMNVPVVASNVCQRPEGTILFESRNRNDFEEKVKACLKKRHEFKSSSLIFEQKK